MTSPNIAEIVGKLREAKQALDAYMASIGGCGDGYCIIVKPKGMHTNGGCRCSTDRYKMQKYAYAHNRFADEVRAHLSTPIQDPIHDKE